MPLKILLADDSMTAQKMAKEILTTAGYEVTAVSNGAVAAKKLADKPDIIILDVFMPGYSGLELCEKIRASMDLAKTPVLLTVGKMEPYKAEDGQKVKADGVIIKPFEATDLLAAVQKLADKLAEEAKPKTKSGAYEKTMIFKAPQVIEEFKDESYAEWKSEADQASEASQPMQMSSEAGSAPAFGADMMDSTASAPATFEAPAPVAFETPASVESAAPAYDYSSSAAPAFEVPTSTPATEPDAPAVPVDETANVAFAQRISGVATPAPKRKRNTAEIQAGAAIAAAAANAQDDVSEPAATFETPAPAVEAALTPVESQSLESLLERTSEPSSPTTTAPPEMEFTGSAAAGEVEITPDPALDRGEASYGSPTQDPALETDATKMATEFPTKFGTSEPEAALEAEPSAAATDDFDAKVNAAMSGYDTGSAEPATVEAQSEITPAASTPTYEDTQRITAPVEPEVINEAKAAQEPPPGMHDAELVEQMQAAFANLPVATTPHEEHIETAAPAETPAPTPPPVAASGRPDKPDIELANALAAAVGGDTASSAEAPATGDDTHRVVTRVLERMLPSIMAELAKEMEAAKKK